MSASDQEQDDTKNGRTRVRPALAAVLLLVLGMLALLLGPASFGPGSPDAEAATRYQRIIALTPFSANAMAEMGVFPKAIGQTLGGDRRYVSGLRTTPRLRLSHPFGPNMEVLQKWQPDLIFTSPEWRKGRETMKGIVVKEKNGQVISRGRVVDADPTSVRAVFEKTRQIARLVEAPSYRRDRLLNKMKASIRRALRGLGAGGQKKPDVMVVLGVGTNNPLAFRPDSWGGEIVRMAGGQLRPGGLTGGGFADISNETVMIENPDVIIAVPHGDEAELTPKAKKDFVDQWPGITSRVVFSEDNSLLQAGTDIGATITKVRRFLGN